MESEFVEKVWEGFPGQNSAKDQLNHAADRQVHAYMFLGESGTTEAAFRFATLVHLANMADEASQEDKQRVLSLGLQKLHPDVMAIDPDGATLRVGDAEEVIKLSATTPLESAKKVIIIPSIDEIEPGAIGKLLKVIEEPPKSVVFILLAQVVLPEIVTIASRCTQIVFAPYSETEIVSALVVDGVAEDKAQLVAKAAGGNIDRARLLATDESLAKRSEFWISVPSRLDGTGSRVAGLVNELEDQLSAALESVDAKHAEALEAVEQQIKDASANNQTKSKLVANQKREIRKFRSQELKFGMAQMAGVYRDQLVNEDQQERISQLIDACEVIQRATEALVRNPNETLLLQDLLYKLPVA